MAAMQRGFMGPKMGDGGGQLAEPIRPDADPTVRSVEVKTLVKNASIDSEKGRIRVGFTLFAILNS